MKIRSVRHNNRKKAFEIKVGTRTLTFPYSQAVPQPTADDPVRRVAVDKELAREGFTYVLESGREGTVHVEQVLEDNEDPSYLRDLLLYRRLDQTNYSKSVDQLLALLQVLDCDVEFVVRAKSA